MKKILLLLCVTLITITGAQAQLWINIPSGTTSTLYSCSFGDPSTVYAVGSLGTTGNTIIKSTNAGLSFSSLSTTFLSLGQMLLSTCFTSTNTGFIGGGLLNPSSSSPFYVSGFIYKTINGGVTWTAVATGAPAEFRAIYFPTPQVGYATGGTNSTGIIYRTTDFGATWAPLYSSISNTSLTRGSTLDDTTGFVVGQDIVTHTAKFITIQHGFVSANVNLAGYRNFSGVYFTAPDTGFVSAVDTTPAALAIILKTVDTGHTWTSVYTAPNSYAQFTVRFANRLNGFAIGDRNLMTTDGGNTWGTLMPLTTGASLYGMDFSKPNDVGILVGEGGVILRNGAVTAVPGVTAGQQQLSLQPNPFSTQTELHFATQQSNTPVIITDMLGRKIRSLHCNGKQLTIEKSDMAPGMYFVTIIPANEPATTLKMVVQ